MKLAGISLQRISLGALIIALGLLVDDAMIAVEMMITKIEEGYDKIRAATFAYTSTAFPMLTGTLVTIAGFVPVGFAQSGAGEYCFTLFAVVGIALDRVVGRGGAVHAADRRGHPARQARRSMADTAARASRAGSTTPSTMRCATSGWCWPAPSALFVLSLVGMRFVQQQFFPASDRPELLVDLTLPQSASLNGHAGGGRPRGEAAQGRSRHRALELLRRPGRRPLLPAARCPARQRLLRAGRGRHQGLQAARRRAGAAREGARRRASTTCWPASARWSSGPPVGWPLKFRVSGPDPAPTRELRAGLRAGARREPQHAQHQLRLERAGQGRSSVEVDQDRARTLGISSQQLANNINSVLSGTTITQLRDVDLSDRHRRPRHPRGARQARDAAQPDAGDLRRAQRAAGADRDALLRPGAAADLASPAPADRDRAGRRGAGHRGDHGRQAARSRRSPKFRAKLPLGLLRGSSAAPSRTAPRRRPASSWCFR